MIELIKFGAEWCQPCAVVAPIVKKLEEKYNIDGSDIKITSIDIDENPEISQEHKVMSIPTFVIKKDGIVKFKRTGALTESQLETEITNVKENE